MLDLVWVNFLHKVPQFWVELSITSESNIHSRFSNHFTSDKGHEL